MVQSKNILLGLLATIIGLSNVFVAEAASNGTSMDFGIISIPAQADMCSCSLTLSCKCCQSVTINPMNETKSRKADSLFFVVVLIITFPVCLTAKLSILSGSVDLGVTMDGQSVAAFTVSTKTPPTYCLPILSMASLDVCLKLNFKIAGTAVKTCPTFYTTYNSNQVVSYDFPCLQVGLNGVSLV
ncbi:hypothetical protein KR009_007957 [Drosophila setifemur]|nr:hypothetical protein KR009_007957 [Drosophila setifemur]